MAAVGGIAKQLARLVPFPGALLLPPRKRYGRRGVRSRVGGDPSPAPELALGHVRARSCAIPRSAFVALFVHPATSRWTHVDEKAEGRRAARRLRPGCRKRSPRPHGDGQAVTFGPAW